VKNTTAAMSEDAVQRSRWSLAGLSQAFYEVVTIERLSIKKEAYT